MHAVFAWEAHGTTYASISPVVAALKPDRAVVPHIVALPLTYFTAAETHPPLRSSLDIPSNALVLCRHGGKDTFDVPFIQDDLCNLVLKYQKNSAISSGFRNDSQPFSQLHFVLMGTPEFRCKKEDKTAKKFIHFISSTTHLGDKERFFRTCDAMIHARKSGETFGLAIGTLTVVCQILVTFFVAIF